MVHAVPSQTLAPVGNTVRLREYSPRPAGATAVLVVDQGATSRLWLETIARTPRPNIRHFLTTADVGELLNTGRLHVVPRVAPSFLVAIGGFFVDAFPAPLPVKGEAVDPLALLDRANALLVLYDR